MPLASFTRKTIAAASLTALSLTIPTVGAFAAAQDSPTPSVSPTATGTAAPDATPAPTETAAPAADDTTTAKDADDSTTPAAGEEEYNPRPDTLCSWWDPATPGQHDYRKHKCSDYTYEDWKPATVPSDVSEKFADPSLTPMGSLTGNNDANSHPATPWELVAPGVVVGTEDGKEPAEPVLVAPSRFTDLTQKWNETLSLSTLNTRGIEPARRAEYARVVGAYGEVLTPEQYNSLAKYDKADEDTSDGTVWTQHTPAGTKFAVDVPTGDATDFINEDKNLPISWTLAKPSRVGVAKDGTKKISYLARISVIVEMGKGEHTRRAPLNILVKGGGVDFYRDADPTTGNPGVWGSGSTISGSAFVLTPEPDSLPFTGDDYTPPVDETTPPVPTTPPAPPATPEPSPVPSTPAAPTATPTPAPPVPADPVKPAPAAAKTLPYTGVAAWTTAGFIGAAALLVAGCVLAVVARIRRNRVGGDASATE